MLNQLGPMGVLVIIGLSALGAEIITEFVDIVFCMITGREYLSMRERRERERE